MKKIKLTISAIVAIPLAILVIIFSWPFFRSEYSRGYDTGVYISMLYSGKLVPLDFAIEDLVHQKEATLDSHEKLVDFGRGLIDGYKDVPVSELESDDRNHSLKFKYYQFLSYYNRNEVTYYFKDFLDAIQEKKGVR